MVRGLHRVGTPTAALVLLMASLAGRAAPCTGTRLWTLPLAPAPAAALEAHGAERLWGGANLALGAGGEVLEVAFPAGSINPGNSHAPLGGAGFLYPGPAPRALTRACLSYELRFPAGFDFVRGGKLPGLYGGDAPSGGAEVDGAHGFSVRLMWRALGAGEAYLYTANKTREPYGESVGRDRWRFVPGQWHRVQLELELNAPDARDGRLALWIDGQPVLQRDDIVYRTTAAIGIDGLMFSTFFGGHDAAWATPRDQRLEFRQVELYAP